VVRTFVSFAARGDVPSRESEVYPAMYEPGRDAIAGVVPADRAAVRRRLPGHGGIIGTAIEKEARRPCRAGQAPPSSAGDRAAIAGWRHVPPDAAWQGVPLKTVQSRYRYGLDKLRVLLNGEVSRETRR
jgi:hypothetical protein